MTIWDETKYTEIMCPTGREAGLVEQLEMIAWITENIENNWTYVPYWDVIQFRFEVEEDAMAFKLKWL